MIVVSVFRMANSTKERNVPQVSLLSLSHCSVHEPFFRNSQSKLLLFTKQQQKYYTRSNINIRTYNTRDETMPFCRYHIPYTIPYHIIAYWHCILCIFEIRFWFRPLMDSPELVVGIFLRNKIGSLVLGIVIGSYIDFSK